ncbi:hypothetical protein Tco_0382892 [Tanacetum coccineum]
MATTQKTSNPKKICNFMRRVRGLKVFMSNFTYECDFVILEDTSSVIDHYLGGMVLGKPFVKESRLVYDKDEGTIMFEKDNEIITYKMPHKMKIFKNIEDLNTDNIPPFIITSDDDKENIRGFVNRQSKEADHERYRCGSDPGHYLNCLNLGPEYKHDESVTKAIRCLIKMRSRISEGGVTSYLMRRVRKFFGYSLGRFLDEDLAGIILFLLHY